MNPATSTPFEVDVVVVGAGMVGATCATALLQAGFSCVLIERTAAQPVDLDGPPGLRVSAVSRASERVLSHIGAWQTILDARAAPYRRMAVWENDDGAETVFDASEIAEPHLGHIVENALIQEACLAAYQRAGGVLLCPASVDRIAYGRDQNRVMLDSGDTVVTRLVIAADGAKSALRSAAGIAAPAERYEQDALVATVVTECAQQDITWQRFQPTGPEALLPLTGRRASLVWYHTPQRVAELRALDERAFLDALHAQFPARLGRVESVIERGSFPLFRSHASRYVQEGLALIGDAAHSVHPLAGQGVNLGFMDAAALVEVLQAARAARRHIGAERVLRRYERWRRGENEMMANVLHGFQQGFGSDAPALKLARSALLSVGASAVPARKLLCRHAMGLAGDLPPLARAQSA